ncbi:Gag protein [Phytophthora palmivora]|uniref:Gag protein n=1 Tax=Phytophthora palmivora TaxID=4796 RepID=A0A2P4YC06_9STRA|nr:Gag protein [Phytophthora palmivora]
MKPAQPKPLRLKVNLYGGKEEENLHFTVREVELAMDAALISTERLRVAFALSNLGGRVKTWAFAREVTSPGCFTTWAQLCQQLRAAFLPANYEYRQRSRFLACKQGKRELHEYIQEMRLFRVHANTMEEAIQNGLQEEYSPRQARTPTSVWQGHNASSGAVQGAPAAGASTGGSRGPWQKPRSKRQGNWVTSKEEQRRTSPHGRSADGARHGGLAPESLGALETRKSSDGLLVVHASTVARSGDKYPEALRESEGRGQVSVGLADGTVVNVPGVRMDLAVKFEDFDSTESFLVLDMDKYDLILGMPWLEKHEP